MPSVFRLPLCATLSQKFCLPSWMSRVRVSSPAPIRFVRRFGLKKGVFGAKLKPVFDKLELLNSAVLHKTAAMEFR